MAESKEIYGLIDTMFDAFPREYGVSDATIARRKAVYVKMLKDLPIDAIRLAIRKSYLETDKVPSIAILVRSIRSLMGAVDENKRMKKWDEAWSEITRQMYACPYGKSPQWSTPEIAEAINTYGWLRLQTVNAGTDFAVAESQIRRYYEQVCNRVQEEAINHYILSKAYDIKGLSRSDVSLLDKSKVQTNTNTRGEI